LKIYFKSERFLRVEKFYSEEQFESLINHAEIIFPLAILILLSIGTLGAEGQLEFLKQRYSTGGFNDRYMAIKAMGDIGTPEALQFIKEIKKDSTYNKEAGLKYCVDLYAP